MPAAEALTKQVVEDPGPSAVYGEDQLPGAAHIEDFRPGAVMQTYRKGQSDREPHTVTSYPYTMIREDGVESVWVDTDTEYPPSPGFPDGFTAHRNQSLVDHGVVPTKNGVYNRRNVDKLVKPAPVDDPNVPKSLRKLLEQPYSNLTNGEKTKATRYFLGQQAAFFLRHKRLVKDEKRLKHYSVEVD